MAKPTMNIYRKLKAPIKNGKYSKSKAVEIQKGKIMTDSYVEQMNTAFAHSGIYYEKVEKVEKSKSKKK